MNSSFQRIANEFLGPKPVLSHKQQITRMYKYALRLSLSWAVDRQVWHAEATEIRKALDSHKHLSPDSGLAKRLVREMEEKLEHFQHPELYVIPWMPGGSKFMRNPPLPLHVCFDGQEIPQDALVSPIKEHNIDMTPMPVKKKVLVNFVTKQYQA